MSSNTFFDDPTRRSIIKMKLVTKYFDAWSRIMTKQRENGRDNRIGYADLFSGPGSYIGYESTPLWILRQAIDRPDLRLQLVTWFNDKNPMYIESLRAATNDLEGMDQLSHSPVFTAYEVADDLADDLSTQALIPTLFFVDPWGYKGLSQHPIRATLQNWGCECIFFFNYNRINPGLHNNMVEQRMVDIFGQERFATLRNRTVGLSPSEREAIIIAELGEALKASGGRFILPFRFKDDSGTRTSHYIMFVTKHFLGFKIMKDIMVKEGRPSTDIAASFEFATMDIEQLGLFSNLEQSFEDFQQALLGQFAGDEVTLDQAFERFEEAHPTSFTYSDYRRAFATLADNNLISHRSYKTSKRAKGTFAKHRIAIFPSMSHTKGGSNG